MTDRIWGHLRPGAVGHSRCCASGSRPDQWSGRQGTRRPRSSTHHPSSRHARSRGIEAFVEIKQRDPRFGHQRIAARVEYNQPSHFGANDMSKERNSSRETKKPPATTQKEKKAAKKAKKDAKKQLRD